MMGMSRIKETCGKLTYLDILENKKYPNETLDIYENLLLFTGQISLTDCI